jgi:hypothetical protein
MLRHIAMQLDESCREKPLEAVAICDALWEESFLETRLLAAALLGQTGDLPPQTILTRVETWAAHTSEDRHLHALVNQALSPILHSHSDLVLEHAGIWLVSENLSLNVTSMRTLISLASDPAFDNLPAILLLITPYIRKAALPIRPDVLDLLAALARRSPRETAFFLRQNFESPDNPDTAWLARQTLQHFPEDVQTSLRNSLRQLNS